MPTQGTQPTNRGGILAWANTPWGNFVAEWDENGNLLREECKPQKKGEVAKHYRETWLEAARRAAHGVVHGAVGLSKAALGVDATEKGVRDRRWEVCRSCDKATRNKHGEPNRCGECGCVLAAKIRIARESCPLHKW
tara:strand:- start:7806 stop:8216 length:411 start_codon:yes stop_codon:yes gene_type:complete